MRQRSGRTAYLFPGQGSQAIGMGRELVRSHAATARYFELASELTGQPLRRICLEGPLDLLSRTDILQPCLAAVSLGCLSALEEAGLRPELVAGHSLGEFVALVAAGMLEADDALRLVAERGRLMHEASLSRSGLMVAVTDVPAETIERMTSGAAPLVVANYNSPRQTVLSGAAGLVEAAERELRGMGGRAVRLPVSGAWHSPLMAGANATFERLLAGTPLREPQRRLFLNVTGAEARSVEQVRSSLAVQMVSPVRWSQLTERMIDAGATTFVEVGPGRVLRGLLRHIWMDYGAYEVVGIDGPLAVDAFARRTGKAA